MEEWIVANRKIRIKSLLSRDSNFDIFSNNNYYSSLGATKTQLVQTQINSILLYYQTNNFTTNISPMFYIIQLKSHYSRVFPLELFKQKNKNNNHDSSNP